MIPQRIHFVWIGPEMPAWAERNIAEFHRLNPGYEVRVHGEEVLLEQYRQIYDRIEDLCSRADLLRLSALQRAGGWYFDCDYWPMRPLDDLVAAYGVDGSRMFLAEPHGQNNPKNKVSNSIIGAARDCPAWEPLNDAIDVRAAGRLDRCTFGPFLMTAVTAAHPALFTVAPWPFFYPAGRGHAGRLYRLCLDGRSDYMRHVAPTAGQYPFAMHLWAAGASEIRQTDGEITRVLEPANGPWRGRRAAFPMIDKQWRDPGQCFRALAEGLAAVGCTVEIHPLAADDPFETADMLVIWNGIKGHYGRLGRMARKRGVPALFVENGFFRRDAYSHADHQGILHWASWAHDWDRPAPPEAAERLARVWPHELQPFGDRRGYVLVLGQLAGDGQMVESELCEATPLVKAVARSLPRGTPACWRPHPKSTKHGAAPRYLPLCEADTLEEAVECARFVVCINSNAGNEALTLGCPVMCLGPALYAQAGVALQTPMSQFKNTLTRMLDGWRPETDRVRNYLQWLACRQWNQDEFRQGDVLNELVGRAMA